MLEKEVETAVCKYAKGRDYLVYKFTAPGRRAVPDRLFITPLGIVFFIEFKKPGKRPTKLQLREIEKLNAQGTPAYWVDNIEDGKAIVDKHL